MITKQVWKLLYLKISVVRNYWHYTMHKLRISNMTKPNLVIYAENAPSETI